MSSYAENRPDGCMLAVRIHPGARKNAVTAIHDQALKISLTTPPVEGRANEALIAFLADSLKIPKARIAIVAGAMNHSKTLRISG